MGTSSSSHCLNLTSSSLTPRRFSALETFSTYQRKTGLKTLKRLTISPLLHKTHETSVVARVPGLIIKRLIIDRATVANKRTTKKRECGVKRVMAGLEWRRLA